MNARDALLQLTDASNWPNLEIERFIGYEQAMAAVHELVMEFWPELTEKTLPEEPTEGLNLEKSEWNPDFCERLP